MDFSLAALRERIRCAEALWQASHFDMTPLRRFQRAGVGNPAAWSFLEQMDGVRYAELPATTLSDLQAGVESALALPAGYLAAPGLPADVAAPHQGDHDEPSTHEPLPPIEAATPPTEDGLRADHLLEDREAPEDAIFAPPLPLPGQPHPDDGVDDLYAVVRLEQAAGLLNDSSDEHRSLSLTEMLGPEHVAHAMAEENALADAGPAQVVDLSGPPILLNELLKECQGRPVPPAGIAHAVMAPTLYMPRTAFDNVYMAAARVPHARNSAELAMALSAFRDLGGAITGIREHLPEGYTLHDHLAQETRLHDLLSSLSLCWSTGLPLQVQGITDLDQRYALGVDPFESLGQLRHYILCHLTFTKHLLSDAALDALILEQVLPDIGVRPRSARHGIRFVSARRFGLAGACLRGWRDAPLRA